MAFILMIPIWLYTDGVTLLGGPSAPRAPGFLSLFMLFSLNGSVHFAQCLLAFTILVRALRSHASLTLDRRDVAR